LFRLKPGLDTHGRLIQGGVQGTFAANIALQYGAAGTVGINALIASGLVLFVIGSALWVVTHGDRAVGFSERRPFIRSSLS